ncbi:MAG: tetratricopeptide repeat protein [Pyrinomonadaceae bacterium]
MLNFLRITCFLVTFLYSPAIFGQSAADISPSETNPTAVALIKEAVQLEESGRLYEAIGKFKEVLKIEPKDFAAMNSIAGIYGVLKQPQQQVDWAQRSFDANPKYWKALIYLGNGQAVLGKFEVALATFEKARSIAPNEPLPVYSLGVVAENRDQIAEALKFYLKSVELDPKFQNGLFSAAAMHASLGQFAEAKKLLTRLLEIEPRDQDARQMLIAIERDMAKP